MASRKKGTVTRLIGSVRRWEMKRLRESMKRREQKLAIKAKVQKNSNSLLWVWEFSKKAVLICFLFYVAVQVYAMVVMVQYQDFTYLGSLIEETGDITRDCVFAYLIKAGLENIGKIWFSNSKKPKDERIADGEDAVG